MEFKILEEVLDNLPDIVIERPGGDKNYKPVFNYGTKADLLKFLRLERKRAGKHYPLIWLETPIELVGDLFPEVDCNFVLATLSNQDLSNRERIRISFDTTLEPLLKSVKNALNLRTNASLIDKDRQQKTNYFNYDTDSSHGVNEIWDAISFKCKIKFNFNC